MTSNATLVDKVKLPEFGQWRFSLWLQGSILFLTSLIISGYQIYSGNHAVQIPLIQSINDPTLFPNDPFVSTLVHYIGPIWWLLGVFINLVSLEILLGLFFLASRALIFIAVLPPRSYKQRQHFVSTL